MSGTLADAKATMAAEEGKLKKLLKAIKKVMAKEFLWVLLVLILAIPLAFIFMYILDEYASGKTVEYICEILGEIPLFMGCYLLSIAGIYFARMTNGAIKTLTEKKK